MSKPLQPLPENFDGWRIFDAVTLMLDHLRAMQPDTPNGRLAGMTNERVAEILRSAEYDQTVAAERLDRGG